MSDERMKKVVASYQAWRRRRTHKGLLITGLLLAGGIALFLKVDRTWGGLSAAIFGLFFVLLVFQRLGDSKHPALDVLLTRPEEVVWLYFRAGNNRNLGFGVVLGLRGGELLQIEHSYEWLLDQLVPLLPHAKVGFTPELAEAFKSDPASVERLAA